MRGYLFRTATVGRFVPLFCLAVSGVGCASARSRERSAGVVVVEPVPATVVVRNHHGADLRVYATIADGKSHRLGLVPKFGAATLELPRSIRLPVTLSFVAIPMSDGEPQATGPIDVGVGTRLVFTVAHAASLSTLTKLP